MANKKISELVLTDNLTDSDVIPVVNSNETKKVAMSSIKEYAKPSEATTEEAGLLSTTDKTKIDGIEEQAQVNKIETIKVNGVEVTPIEKIVDLIISSGEGGEGTTDYSALSNKPTINNVELSGNKSSEDLGIIIPTTTSQLTNDSGYVTSIEVNNIKVLTEAEYTALTEYGANTLYIVPNE